MNKDKLIELFERFKFIPINVNELDIKSIDRKVVSEPIFLSLQKCFEHIYKKEIKDGYIFSIQAILDHAWERFNISEWHSVDVAWRLVYSYASLAKALVLLAEEETNILNAIEACDMGLLMGAPILDNILAKLAGQLASQIENQDLPFPTEEVKEPENFPPINCPLPKVVCPTILDFKLCYLDLHEPVVVKDAINYWPALSTRKWSVESLLKRAGCRVVPVEIGSRYTDESWTQKLMTLNKFASTFLTPDATQVGYLAQHQIFNQIPELGEDVPIPPYTCLGENPDVDINVWFGPNGTVSPLHYDPKENLLAQVLGYKYVRLYKEKMTPFLYPHPNRLLHNTSQVDIENPNLEEMPLFAKAKFEDCILGPGDMLFIPARCWHFVRSLSVSLSISFWWS